MPWWLHSLATFVDICFSLPRSIPAIAEKQTQKIAGTRSSKFVFYDFTQSIFGARWFFNFKKFYRGNQSVEYYIIKILPTYYINTFIPERDYLGTLNLTLRHDDLKAYR